MPMVLVLKNLTSVRVIQLVQETKKFYVLIKLVQKQKKNVRKIIKNAHLKIQFYVQMEIVVLVFMIVMKVNVQVGVHIIVF